MAGHPEQERDQTGTRVIGSRVRRSWRTRCARRCPSGWARHGLVSGSAAVCGWGLSGDGSALEVQVPDPFFREWIQSHYTNSLIEAAEAVVGRRLQLSIQIHDETEPPAGGRGRARASPHRARSGTAAPGGITIPLPGNPKAPLSFPSPSPSGPGPSSPPGPNPLPQTDHPQPPKRMQAPASTSGPSVGRIGATAGAAARGFRDGAGQPPGARRGHERWRSRPARPSTRW